MRLNCTAGVVVLTFTPLALFTPSTAHSALLSLTLRAEQCIVGASQYHSVSPVVLKAIVRHESRGNPKTISRNSNNSVDVGLAGINSIHFPELRQKGVSPEQLLDECVSVYVGAWKYSKKVFKYGNTWRAIGAYHSETDYYSSRYQALIYNELVDMGMADTKMSIPALAPR